ncbi:MAG TPA: YqgE/AlgH family protein [Hyphomicrobiaceae bacterium]|nr:YqgE/AlgH family protein [Hyphomicrobiaceae bacterium]
MALLSAGVVSTGLRAALPRSDPPPGLEQEPMLTGHLLLAAPGISDPRFWHTAILMVRHDRTGALGIVVNRPLGTRPLAILLEPIGDEAQNARGTVRIFAGGPVQPEVGFIVHSAEYEHHGTTPITAELAVTTNLDVLRDIARGKGPRKALIALGYAGWGAGQLETELARDDWVVGPADPDLVFDTPRERVWSEAMARRVREVRP